MVEGIQEWRKKIVNFLANVFRPKELREDQARKQIKECGPNSLVSKNLYRRGKDDILRCFP